MKLLSALSLALSPLMISGLPIPRTLNNTLPAHHIQKRAMPNIGAGFSDQEVLQMTDGHKDAMQMADYITTRPRNLVDPILGKYFAPEDFDTVLTVYKNLLGPDKTGNHLLPQIAILHDFPDPITNLLTCEDAADVAELRHFDTSYPTMIVCDPIFKHGGIGKGYGSLPFYPYRIPAVTYSTIGDRISWKMDTLGATFLHEYTHWKLLVSPPLARRTNDGPEGKSYGAYKARKLDRRYALYNADNYLWAAIENLWNELCQREFKDPLPDDANDPLCGLTACIR